MAFDVTALSAYIEDQDFPLIASMQATGGLAEVVNIQTGIKESSNLQFLDSDVIFQADSCSRAASGTTTFTQRTITVGAVAVHKDLCVKELNGFWTQTMVKQGCAGEEELPAPIEGVLLDKILNKTKYQLTLADFQGDILSSANNLSYYDGLLKIVDAAAGVVNGNTGSVTVATGITTANVLDILDAVWTAIPDNIMNKENLSLWVPISVHKKYVVALKNANLFHISVEDGETKLYGTNVNIRPTVGLPSAAGTERMILTHDDNITIGMDGDAEEDSVKVRLDPVSEKTVFLDMCFKRGVQIAFPEEIVEFTLVP